MAANLSSIDSIQTNLFVQIDIPDYEVLTFSDYYKNYTISGTTYQGLSGLLSITTTTNNLRAAPDEISITISGIPYENVSDITNNKIKGSSVKIYRAFFNTSTGALLSVVGLTNPSGKFQGIISNYIISDDLEMGSSTGTISLTLTAVSVVALLENKLSGRRTNPIDFPLESSMNRVSALAKSNFNFGAPT